MAEQGEYQRARDLSVKFVELLIEESDYSLKIKVDSLVQLFNSVHTLSGIKSYALEKLIDLTLRENCTDILIERARKVVEETAGWNLTIEERRSLYSKVGRALDQLGESGAAFKVLFANLKLYKESDELTQTE